MTTIDIHDYFLYKTVSYCNHYDLSSTNQINLAVSMFDQLCIHKINTVGIILHDCILQNECNCMYMQID